MPEEERVEKERETLSAEVEKVKQLLVDNSSGQEFEPVDDEKVGNVIYLGLREERIRRRSVA